jgi:uncharacterized membrane protein YdfJ with MMPL/SSD domain
MVRPWEIVVAIAAAALLAGVMVANAAPTQSEKSTGGVTPRAAEKAEQEKSLAEAAEAAKQLLLVMDTNQSGKVSKQEWMNFMEAEFERLDTGHKGQLDVKELTQSRVRYRAWVGK